MTESLYDSLWQLRNKWRKILVWGDAIRINQQEDVEKSSQVSVMTDIYASAPLTIVWLRREEEHDCHTVQL